VITREFDVEFTKDGTVHDERQVTALLEGLDGATDLLVLAHGWNNDLADATALYDELVGNLTSLLTAAGGEGPQLAVMRAFWPSKKFADEDLIPGDSRRGGGPVAAAVPFGGAGARVASPAGMEDYQGP